MKKIFKFKSRMFTFFPTIVPQNLVLNFWTWSKCQTRCFFVFVFFLKWVLNLVYIILKFYYSEKCKLYLEVSWKRFSTEKVIFPISGAVYFVQWDETFFQTPNLSNCLDFCSGAASVESHAELVGCLWCATRLYPDVTLTHSSRCYDHFSALGQNLSRACLDVCSTARISLPIVHFISNTIEKEKKKKI